MFVIGNFVYARKSSYIKWDWTFVIQHHCYSIGIVEEYQRSNSFYSAMLLIQRACLVVLSLRVVCLLSRLDFLILLAKFSKILVGNVVQTVQCYASDELTASNRASLFVRDSNYTEFSHERILEKYRS